MLIKLLNSYLDYNYFLFCGAEIVSQTIQVITCCIPASINMKIQTDMKIKNIN